MLRITSVRHPDETLAYAISETAWRELSFGRSMVDQLTDMIARLFTAKLNERPVLQAARQQGKTEAARREREESTRFES